jgi:hypothetical protein
LIFKRKKYLDGNYQGYMLQFQAEDGSQGRPPASAGLEKEWENQEAKKGEIKVERTGYGRYIYKRRSPNMLEID